MMAVVLALDAGGPIGGEVSDATDGRPGLTLPTDPAVPVASAAPGAAHVMWTRKLADIVPGTNHWLSQIVTDGDTWLVRVIVDGAGPVGGGSFIVPLDARTGDSLVETPDAALPEDAYCAESLVGGMLACGWSDAVRFIDPRTGEADATAPARVPGLEIYGVEVVEGRVVAVGLSGFAPEVVALDVDGTVAWRSMVELEGCSPARPEYSASVVLAGGDLRVGLAGYQFVLDSSDGSVLVRACGQAAYAPSGAMAVAGVEDVEPLPPPTYVGADGTVHPIVHVGQAVQVVAMSGADDEYVAVLTDEHRLRLVHLLTGIELWEREWQYGRVQAWDDERIYLSGRHGLSALSPTTGEMVWTWSGEPGMAVRTALLVEDSGLVAATSSGVSGLAPATGEELWTVRDPELAGWYWLPPAQARTPGAVRVALLLVGVDRDKVSRLDLLPHQS